MEKKNSDDCDATKIKRWIKRARRRRRKERTAERRRRKLRHSCRRVPVTVDIVSTTFGGETGNQARKEVQTQKTFLKVASIFIEHFQKSGESHSLQKLDTFINQKLKFLNYLKYCVYVL